MAETALVAAIASATGASAGTVVAVGAATAAAVSSIAISSYSAKKAEADARKEGSRAPRDITVRSAVEPARIIYGTARTSGPVVYTNTAPTPGTSDNSTLWTAISLCQHEIDDITEIWLDGDKILWSGLSGTGGVTSGKYGPIGGNEVTNFYRRLGTDTQTHVTELATAFSDWTADYDGKGVAYIVCAFELGTATGEGVWAQGAPKNIRAVIKGKKVYDPRKDSTQTGGSGAHRLADPTTWEWSDNPALCVADYLFDARLGMGAEGITYNEIDWDLVFAAANACDTLVTTPDGNQKRFTCNGALSTGETYAENIKQLLSSMSGQITWSGGKFRIRAAAYEAPTYTFTGDDVVGDVQIQPERTRTQRYNKIRGTFIDPDSDYVATQFIPVENTSYKNTRDGGQTLTQEIKLPFTNDEYMAQRIAFKQLNLNNQQLRCIVPFNWKAMKVAVGDRIQLSIDELSWSNKVFRVDGWSFSPDSGFNLELQEDSSSAYADPLLAEYSTRTLAGVVSFADQAVSAPSGLQATSEEEAVLLEWDPPPRPSGYDEVVIYASATSAWSGATEIGRTRGSTFRHELTRGTARYYWVRAVDVDGRESIRDPDSDTSSITATAGQIATSQLDDDANFALTADWPSVTDSLGTAPEDNATVGATVGTDLYDTDGSTVLGQTDVLNSILEQDILRVELEAETILNLETGLEVDIQNLGDVAIFVNESNSTIQGNIDTLEGNIQNLTSLIGDVTAGVGDVYLQDSEPVAGVGGIPDPIPDGSRWYDTDDNNAPYYWNGTAWVSLLDPRIGQNAAAVVALQTRMTTAEGDIDTNTADIATNGAAITANASAISTLDSTVTSQGNSITAIAADITDLETVLQDAGGNFSTTSNAITVLQSRVTQTETDITSNSTSITTLTNNLTTTNSNVSTNASAISALDTRVTSAEGSITSQASDISTLQSDLTTAEGNITTNASAITALTTRVTSAEGNISVNSSDILTLTSDLQAAESDIADNAAELVTQATQASVLTARIDFITKVEGEADQDPIDLETSGELDLETLDDVTSATSSAITSLDVRTTAAEGSLVTQASDITQLQSVVNDASTGVLATATAVDSLETRVTVTEGDISSVASDLSSLTTTVGGNTASITTQATSIDGLEAQYTVKIDNNGRVAGFGLASTAADATPFSEFVVIADQFSIVNPASTADTPLIPFQVSAGKATFTSDVVINGDLITTGTITATRLNLNGTMFTAPSGVLTIADGGVDTTQVAAAAITETSVATATNYTVASTTQTDTGLTITVTIPAGATILLTVSFEYSVSGTASTNRCNVLLVEDATTLRNVAFSAGGTNNRGVATFVEAITNSTGSDSTRTYKTQAANTSVLTTTSLTEQHITVTELKR